jgi:hypothetical protein
MILVAEMREEEMFSSKPKEQMELKKLSFSSSAPLRLRPLHERGQREPTSTHIVFIFTHLIWIAVINCDTIIYIVHLPSY